MASVVPLSSNTQPLENYFPKRLPENSSSEAALSSLAMIVGLGITAMIGCGIAGLRGRLSLSAGGTKALLAIGTVLAIALMSALTCTAEGSMAD